MPDKCMSQHWGTDGKLHYCDRETGHLSGQSYHHHDGLLWLDGRKSPYKGPNRWHRFRQWLSRKSDPGQWYEA